MLRRLPAFFACLFLIAACQQTPPVRLEALRFTGPAFTFNAAEVQIVKSAPDDPRDIQGRHQFPTRLDAGMEQWTKDRLAFRDGDGILKLDIQRASVTEEQLPVTQGFSGLFKNEQSARYTAAIKVDLSLYAPDRPTARAGVSAEASRSITLPEGASVAERQQAFNTLVIETLRELDGALSQRIPEHLGPYLTMN